MRLDRDSGAPPVFWLLNAGRGETRPCRDVPGDHPTLPYPTHPLHARSNRACLLGRSAPGGVSPFPYQVRSGREKQSGRVRVRKREGCSRQGKRRLGTLSGGGSQSNVTRHTCEPAPFPATWLTLAIQIQR